MSWGQYFDPFWFLVSLGIGILIVYTMAPEPDVIIKYPTPDNAGKVIYRDSNDVCYKYKAQLVSCPADKSGVKEIQVQ